MKRSEWYKKEQRMLIESNFEIEVEFTLQLFASLKTKFADNAMYSGKEVKLYIDGIIRRLE